MLKIRKGDEVIVTTGKDKGKRGRVAEVVEGGKLIVEGVNLVQKHVRPNPMRGIAGGITPKEMPLNVSNVALLNPLTGKGDRVGFRVLEDSRKVRVFKSNGEVVDA